MCGHVQPRISAISLRTSSAVSCESAITLTATSRTAAPSGARALKTWPYVPLPMQTSSVVAPYALSW